MEQNTAIISLEKYEELIESKHLVDELKKYIDKLAAENSNLKEALLESQANYCGIRDYCGIRYYCLKETEGINDCFYGLNGKVSLLKFFTREELVKFIKRKRAKLEEKYTSELEDTSEER